MADPALRLDGIRRTFVQGDNRIEVLRGAELTVQPGEIVALVGPSGAGKSTLLHTAGLLEAADEGSVTIAGRTGSGLGDKERTRIRRECIGFVYQYHHLSPEFTALENVMLPLLIAGQAKRRARERAGELLGRLGLADRVGHRPARLSGGEQQRVAIARAFINRPKVLFADEPTGNLDSDTSHSIVDLLFDLNRDAGTTLVLVTHDRELARMTDQILRIDNGVVTIEQ